MSITTPEQTDSLIEQDKQARADALDVTRSFLVQAPAGSGKTELLTQRLLALLSEVEEPEQVLAITFTKAATAEMRSRVIGALQRAQAAQAEGIHLEKHKLAIAALDQSQRRGWGLLEQPQRLNIQTIDSLCLRIAHEAPLLSRLGGQLQPTEDVAPLHSLAARRTLEQLGGTNAQLSAALAHLVRLRDVNLSNCAELIADMLGRRDLWLQEFSLARSLTEPQWAELRTRREEPFRRERENALAELKAAVECRPEHFRELLRLAAYACTNEPEVGIRPLASLESIEDLQQLLHFSCIREFVLVQDGAWRKTLNKKQGFPTEKNGGSLAHKSDFEQLLLDMSKVQGLREALFALDSLPDPAFSEEDWQAIRSIFTVLLQAAAELRVVFAERSVIDFVEAGITAEHALDDTETRRIWSSRIHHLLVDEFQDTSRRQYTLLKNIVRDWDAAEHRTCFLVGDPMQSIYLFRNAELALFDEVLQHGFGPDVPALQFTHLALGRNFRSTAGIVEPINAMFDASVQGGAEGAARFTPALADGATSSARALHLHPQWIDQNQASNVENAEAEEAVAIIRSHLPALEAARVAGGAFRIGVLVRNKQHVALLAAALREADIPYRAVDIETLPQRQEVRDLLSLMRALLHPMDRIAWLSVLRAPWCGLSLGDLYILSGSDDRALHRSPMRELLAQRIGLLSKDGQQRATRVQQVLDLALAKRFAGQFSSSPDGLAAWLERTWVTLGGPQCVDASQSANVQAFFRLLAKLPPDGLEASGPTLDERLKNLFAQPDPRAPENCSVQLMTIHKAKGLGFDVVLVPGLHRGTSKQDSPLLRWMVRNRVGAAERELLMAPIGSKGGPHSATYRWLSEQQKRAERAELHRLLYVACTRARSELHLFAALEVKTTKGNRQLSAPSSGTLLACGWGYLQRFATPPPADTLHLVPLEPADDPTLDIAAQGEALTQMLKRLPRNWAWNALIQEPSQQPQAEPDSARVPVHRSAGSPASRARGVVLHALLESLSSLPTGDARRDVRASGSHWHAVATALLHQTGLGRHELETERKSILSQFLTAAADPYAQWILRRRSSAQSEAAWTTQEQDGLRSVRCDRVFLAGPEPLSEGETHLWIVDYKTADGDGAFLLDERRQHEPQLQRYAVALRNATQQALPIRLALYYPALPHLLWWPA